MAGLDPAIPIPLAQCPLIEITTTRAGLAPFAPEKTRADNEHASSPLLL
jgi:hypothetical protein